MDRLFSTLVLVASLSIPTLAGGFLINETGETAYGLRVVFSEPVRITGFGDVLTAVEPLGNATAFAFSAGELEASNDCWLDWEPASASILSLEWLRVGSGHASVATAEDYDFEITLGGADEAIVVSRHIDRHCLPFAVRYEIGNAEALNEYQVEWDADKHVDADGDGDPQNDVDAEGTELGFVLQENYNPTVTLSILDEQGALLGQWENIAQNDFFVGDPIRLALETPESEAAPTAAWSQLHMDRMSLEYMTEYGGEVIHSQATGTEAVHHNPGRYVYEASGTGGGSRASRVAAWVVPRTTSRKPTGFMMADLWNEWYDESCNCQENVGMFFTDEQALEKLRWLTTQGFSHIDIMNQIPLVDTYPEPRFSFADPQIHYMGDADTELMFSEIARGQASWQVYYFGDPEGIDNTYWQDFDELSLDYFAEFWEAYRAIVLQKAALAESLDLESFVFGFQHPYLRLHEIGWRNPSAARFLRQSWIQLINDVCAIFSGLVGLGAPQECAAGYAVAQEADFLYVNVADYGGKASSMKWAETVEELGAVYADYVYGPLAQQGAFFQKPLRFTFWPWSYRGGATDGWDAAFEQTGYDSWDPKYRTGVYSDLLLSGATNPEFPPDFREQVKMIEALMPVLAGAEHVEGIFAEYEYWQLLDFTAFAPDDIIDYFNLFTGSLQGKPAFEAFKLWASVLSPNQRLLYRHSIPFGSAGSASVTPREDWSDVLGAPTLSYAGPADVSLSIGNEPADMALASFWELSGCDVETVKTGIVEDQLLVDLKLREGDEIGAYTYVLRYVVDEARDTRLNVHLCPTNGWVYLRAKKDGGWGQELTLADTLGVFHDGCQAAIPVSAFDKFFSGSDIADSCVDLKLIHPEAQNEMYVYPGSGCLASGGEVAGIDQEQPTAQREGTLLSFNSEMCSLLGDAVTLEGVDSGGVSRIAYTPHVDDDWGGLFSSLAQIEIPHRDFNGTGQFEFDLRISQREGVHLFVVLFERNGEAFTYELPQLPDNELWQEYSVRYEQFKFGGFGSPSDGNGVLDLDGLQQVTVAAVVLEHAGQTVEFQLRNPRFAEARLANSVLTPSEGHQTMDWEDVPWRLQFEEGRASVVSAWRDGQQMDLGSLENWGLDGSDVRGVQISCVEGGCLVRVALWEPPIDGQYTYLIHCWQYPEFLHIEIDPSAGRAWMGTRLQGDDIDLHDRIEFVSADDRSVTVFVRDVDLPTGGTTRYALLEFEEVVLLCAYDNGLVQEAFEIGSQ